jgi:hypothetical protein
MGYARRTQNARQVSEGSTQKKRERHIKHTRTHILSLELSQYVLVVHCAVIVLYWANYNKHI